MKQFSLESFLENPSRKIITRDNHRVRIVCTNMKDKYFRIITLVENDDGSERISTVDSNGKVLIDMDSHLDLFFAPIKKEGWVNIYKNLSGHPIIGDVYKTEKEALENKSSSHDYINTARIEWEE